MNFNSGVDSGVASFSELGSAEAGDEMETDRATPNLENFNSPTVVAQASTGDEDMVLSTMAGLQRIYRRGPTNTTSALAMSSTHELQPFENKKLYELSMFDKKKMLTDLVRATLGSLKSYYVCEPMGCAMLFSSNQTSEEFEAVCTDMEEISRSLEGAGWDLLSKSYQVTKHSLLPKLRNLGAASVFNRSANRWYTVHDYSVFLFYYTGHGQARGVVLNDNCLVKYSDIVKTVSADPHLENKPKIFIFDSCREQKTNEPSYYTQIEDVCNQESEISDSYPPPHTMICFSAAEGRASYMTSYQGSFYTLALSHALRQFGHHLTLAEIITHVNGGTRLVAKSYGQLQHPIFMTNLEKQLVLSVTDSHRGDYKRDEQETQPIPEKGFPTVDTLHKGFNLPKEFCEVVEKDHIPKDPQFKAWSSKEEVMKNIRYLGNGISIFILYAPNPDDPFKEVSQNSPAEQRNQFLLCRLVFDLERHGFHVTSDLHLGTAEPSNWIQWYVTRISHCNFVLFVCSPAFKQLFEESIDIEKLSNPRAKLLAQYRDAVYSGYIAHEINRGGTRKFLPVILDVERYGKKEADCVPLLFQAGTVFQLDKEESRLFDFDNMNRHFERLVCHMAGINRIELTKIRQYQELPTPPGLFDNGLDDDDFESASQGPPQGYVVSTDPLPSRSVVGSSQPPQHSSIGLVPAIHPASKQHPQSQHHQPSYHQPHPQTGYQPYPQPPQPHPQPRYQPYPQPGYQPQPHPACQPQPHPQPACQPHPQAPAVEDPNSLPQKTPDQRIYMWLAKEILSWKFIARNLGLEENNIDRIVADHGNYGTDEMCFQMFIMWERYFTGRGCDYRKLGEVLKDSPKNRHLYAEYVQRVKAMEKIP